MGDNMTGNHRKVVVIEFISADGVIEEPHEWHFPFFSEDMGEILGASMSEFDALLLGRTTYEEFAAAWPQRGDDEGGREMNGAHKYVVTNTLTPAGAEEAWQGSSVIAGSHDQIVEQIRRVKQEPGREIHVWGSATLVPLLLDAGLVDEFQLFVHPIVLGRGKRLFEGAPNTTLRVAEARPLASGTVFMRYEPAEPTAAAGADTAAPAGVPVEGAA